MKKRPLASAAGWMGMWGLVVILGTSACKSTLVEPTPTKTQPADKLTVSDNDPPEKPGKPGGGE